MLSKQTDKWHLIIWEASSEGEKDVPVHKEKQAPNDAVESRQIPYTESWARNLTIIKASSWKL